MKGRYQAFFRVLSYYRRETSFRGHTYLPFQYYAHALNDAPPGANVQLSRVLLPFAALHGIIEVGYSHATCRKIR